jgi:uncharacterized membrane protein
MAYCTQCGNPVGDRDLFCAECGATQGGPAAGSPPSASATNPASSFVPPAPRPSPGSQPAPEFLAGWSDSKVAGLCYIPFVGWVFAIVVLASERFRHATEVRFHAFQGLYLFVVYLILKWVFDPLASHNQAMAQITDFIQLVVIGGGIFMLVKTNHGNLIRLPFLGELADKSVSEQK